MGRDPGSQGQLKNPSLKKVIGGPGWKRFFGRRAGEPSTAARVTDDQYAAACRLYQERRYGETEPLCRAAIALGDRDTRWWELLGAALIGNSRPAEACECFERVVALEPARPGAHTNLAEALRASGRPERAVDECEQALRLEPADAAAFHHLGLALPSLGRMDEAVQALRRACELKPDSAHLRSSLLFALNRYADIDPFALASEHRRWAVDFADPLTAAALPHANRPDPDRSLKIGYVSGDFFRHAVSYFIEPVLAAHDRRQFRTICYFSGGAQDEVTARLRALSGAWHDVAALSDETLAALIREDAVDVLVDLSGHTKDQRLLALARKPAPVQITWLGYLNTTGMGAMDYRLTDAVADPPGESDRLHRERLLRLPACQWCYLPPADAPPVAPLPALASGRVTFASFNQFDKLSERCVALWARVLANVPNAALAVFGVPTPESSDFVLDIFEREGIDIGRIALRRPLAFDAYLRACNEVDIALDSLPYNGGTTTCESLWMGVPVVSRAGVSGAQRSGASLLTAVGLGGLVAHSDEEYVNKACALARELPALAALRSGMRERLARSPLMDAERFVRQLESAYREAWRDWCGHAASRRDPYPGP